MCPTAFALGCAWGLLVEWHNVSHWDARSFDYEERCASKLRSQGSRDSGMRAQSYSINLKLQDLVPTHLRPRSLRGVPENRDRTAVARMAAAVKAGEGSAGKLEFALRHEDTKASIRILWELAELCRLKRNKRRCGSVFRRFAKRRERRTHQPLTAAVSSVKPSPLLQVPDFRPREMKIKVDDKALETRELGFFIFRLRPRAWRLTYRWCAKRRVVSHGGLRVSSKNQPPCVWRLRSPHTRTHTPEPRNP